MNFVNALIFILMLIIMKVSAKLIEFATYQTDVFTETVLLSGLQKKAIADLIIAFIAAIAMIEFGNASFKFCVALVIITTLFNFIRYSFFKNAKFEIIVKNVSNQAKNTDDHSDDD